MSENDETKKDTEQSDDKKTKAAPVARKEKPEPLEVFLKKSGYRPSDVDGFNPLRLTFITTNGGKYQLNRRGDIRILQGPPYPKFKAASDEEE